MIRNMFVKFLPICTQPSVLSTKYLPFQVSTDTLGSSRCGKMMFLLLACLATASSSSSLLPVTRGMYNSISNLMGEAEYPEVWWQERAECLDQVSPDLAASMEKAWAGMVEYWDTRGQEGDPWHVCEEKQNWFEYNCTSQPGIAMDIWEPCNYASNLAYDRLVVEMCRQKAWTFPLETVNKITEAFAIVTFGSAFFHGSETTVGQRQDTASNDLFTYVVHQAAMSNIPYDPVIHDLSSSPRQMSSEEMVDYWLEMFNTKHVSEWSEAMAMLDIPILQKTFSGIFGYILLLMSDLDTTISVATPLMDLLGVGPEDKEFFLASYLPALQNATENVSISLLEKAELLENTAGTVIKLFYAFVWQEQVIDLEGANLSPEANAFGAALLPHINEYANNLTTWSLWVQDVQAGGGYPGSGWCNDIIPHAKWHVETAAGLSDVARLTDMVLRLTSQ